MIEKSKNPISLSDVQVVQKSQFVYHRTAFDKDFFVSMARFRSLPRSVILSFYRVLFTLARHCEREFAKQAFILVMLTSYLDDALLSLDSQTTRTSITLYQSAQGLVYGNVLVPFDVIESFSLIFDDYLSQAVADTYECFSAFVRTHQTLPLNQNDYQSFATVLMIYSQISTQIKTIRQ